MTPPRPKTPGRVVPESQKLTAGAPRKQPPPDALEVIQAASARGASKLGAAMALGCSVDVFNRWLDEVPELAEAFTHGREKERQALHSVLYDAAMGGAVVPALFLLKSRHGYVEGQQDGQANRVSITFALPGAMTPETFTIENHDTPNSSAQRLPAKRITRA